ncbi:MAG: glycosyltransferase family 4 protein [Idiomarina sp.]|nr:glycosyltransferase family 4 protein [Idiomarina sp.]
MKLLIISFYYAPDLCAGSFRCSALVEALQDHDLDIEVVTTLPNRYAGFSADAVEYEQHGNVTIHRVQLPKHESGMFDQAKAFNSFYKFAKEVTKNQCYDAVFATSSRLFSAFLGARIARQKRLPLYLDIRDIFTDTLGDVLPSYLTWGAMPIVRQIERYTFNTAKRINLVSNGFSEYFSQRYADCEYRSFTNGIDREFIDAAPTSSKPLGGEGKIKVLYAGNLGEGQGLHKIIPSLARNLADECEFTVIGAGGRLEQLQRECAELPNVNLAPPVSRCALVDAYRSADVLFLHLNDYEAFEKVLPSKIFEYAALGKPIWAGVGGYAAEFLREKVDNCAVFAPGDVKEALSGLTELRLEEKPRDKFVAEFSRTRIMNAMANDVVQFIQTEK